MRVLLYEFVTGGGLWAVEGQLPPTESLLREGSAMVRAVAEDLLRIDGCRLTTLRDVRLDDCLAVGGDQIRIGSAEQERDELVRQAAAADWTIIIAPEFMGLLEQRCQWAERNHISRIAQATGSRRDTATRTNVLPDSTLVALASDKHATALTLARAGVPVPVSRIIECGTNLPVDFPYPAVAKPVDGAGSLGLQWIEDHRVTLRLTPWGKNRWRLEAYHPGQPASVTLLCGPNQTICLPACSQRLSEDGRFTYLGGQAPLPDELNDRAQKLALRCAQALSARCGYVGIDLILATDPNQSDVVIEVNPRLTTSYVGLRKLTAGNLMQAMLDLADGRQVQLSFRQGTITFDASGSCSELSADSSTAGDKPIAS